MAGIRHTFKACMLVGLLPLVGCGVSASPSADTPSIEVRYRGGPLGDVQVRLHESLGGPVVAESISGPDGKAYFMAVPSPEPASYFVTLESVADGGWMLDPTKCESITQTSRCQMALLKRSNRFRGFWALAACVATVSATHAADSWVSFRDGGSSTTQTPLPMEWTPKQGIAWQKELTGYGQSAPVIFDNKVFVTAVDGPMCEKLVIQAFDLVDGEMLWQYERSATAKHASNYMNARAAPTPLVDGKAVYAFFESGDFVCVDHGGELRWHRNEAESFGKFENNHGIGSSPAIGDKHLFLLLEHDGPSSLVAIDKSTGETAWSTERPSTKSWASPIIVTVGDEEQVVVSSGGTVCGYSAIDGNQVWQLDGIDGNTIPSPVAVGDKVLIAARLPEFANDGDVQSNCCLDLSRVVDGKPTVVWRAEKSICEYASPVVCDGHAYFVSKANVLHCVDVATGSILYRKRLSLDCWATPIVSGNSVYFFGKNGQTRVVRAGSEFAEIASNELWNPDSPPTPEHYVETTSTHGGHGHGHGHSGSGSDGKTGQADRPGGGMVARMMAGDANKDGVLQADELPGPFRPMMKRIDTDGDGKIDAKELEAMAKSFAERRKNASASARDPIVYGVAAADGRIAIRTGTRLFVVDGK